MDKYNIIVGGVVIATVEGKKTAESALNVAKNSFLAIVHPIDTFRIKKVLDNK